MNLSIQEELQPFAEELQHHTTPEFLEALISIKFTNQECEFLEYYLATLFNLD